MNQVQRETLAKLASACSLQELRQMHLEATFLQEPAADQEEITPEVEILLQIARSPTAPKREFATIFRFNVALNTEAESKVAVMKMQYHAVLVYSVAEDSDFADEDIRLFGQTNGMVHVWPYLRAFVQTSCAQLGAPVVTLPPFRVGQALRWQRNDSAETPTRS